MKNAESIEKIEIERKKEGINKWKRKVIKKEENLKRKEDSEEEKFFF